MKKIFFALVLSTLLSVPAFSYTRYEVPEGSVHYAFDIYDAGEYFNYDNKAVTSTYNLTNNQMSALFDAAKKWTEYINFTPNNLPIYRIYSSNELNAFASSDYYEVTNSNYMYTLINSMMTNKQIIPDEDEPLPEFHGLIEVGLGLIESEPKWSNYDGSSAIFKEHLPDIYSTMIHEMYHSIGLASGTSQYRVKQDDFSYYFSRNVNSPISIWDSYLRIYKGNVSSASYYNPSLEIAAARGMSLKIDNMDEGGIFDILHYAPYFAGKETLKVLTGLNNVSVEDMEAYIMYKGGLKNYSNYYDALAKRPLVLGLPVNVIEDSRPELSHIELKNSFMSHQNYQNWAILMEAELAVLKDLGYDVDMRKYFGQSYYLDNMSEVFTRGYGGVWDETSGMYSGRSTTENGIGLHIYGDNNNITQVSDILSDGKYTIGARIDGVNNSYTLNTGNKIDTASAGSIGIATMWGKNHTITLNSGSEVTAKGDGGVAAEFDFGKNVMGELYSGRGSYSEFDGKKNPIAEDALQGPLVENFNVSGKLEGQKASIYISENAHVKNINIENGSSVKGDIISEWNSVQSGAGMYVQDSEGQPVTGEDVSKIYFTNLNFGNGTDSYYGSFSDNITGENAIFNTLKMNVNGTLNFGNSNESKTIDVYNITNNGVLNITGNTSIKTQNTEESITGSGAINVSDGKILETFNVSNINNELRLNAGELDTSNQTKENIKINKLVTSDGSKLDVDLGDTFNITDTSGSTGTTVISRVYADKGEVSQLKAKGTDYEKPLFTNALVDLGTSSTNVYYDGKKYTLSQDSSKQNLVVSSVSASNGVGDAAQDAKTSNYIVAEGEIQNADGGTVTGKTFEVSGDSLNFDGHKGLIIDGTTNPQGTTIKTNTFYASEGEENKGTYTVQNGGMLNIVSGSENPQVAIVSSNNAIYLDDSSNVLLMSDKGSEIVVAGKITGESNENSKVVAYGDNIILNKTDNVALYSKANNLELNGQLSNTTINAAGGEINVNKDSLLAGGTNFLILNGANINLQNDKATPVDLSKLYLNEDTNLAIDVDIKNGKADTFVFENEDDAITNYGTINIDNVNLINTNERTILTKDNYEVPIISPEFKNTELKRSVVFGLKPQSLTTPIYKYNTNFGVTEDGTVVFGLARAGSGYDSFNPAVTVSPVAAQLGGYLSQLNSYDEAFRNLDMKMLMTREERQAYKMANRYASEVQPKVFSPTYLPEKDSAGWFRPYASFEKVNLNGGPNAENIMYGSYFGGDSKMYETKNGWDYQYSVYIGYNGSHQNYQGNSIYQNGGNLGATGIWYKGDFFTALTANVGASVADASTMYGSEDFPMLMTGVASKTGYNWELAKGKFIIQPSWLMSYTFVNTFDYTNSAGVRIKSDPLHAINMAPGLKFIGNLKHGWQPYVGVQMVWNIMDDTHFKAQNVSLPNMSVKPYIQYGVGLQKRWGERFTGFAQAMLRNGGRNGIALSAGFRWAIGKDPSAKKNGK